MTGKTKKVLDEGVRMVAMMVKTYSRGRFVACVIHTDQDTVFESHKLKE